MKFGLRYCNTGRYTDPARAVESYKTALTDDPAIKRASLAPRAALAMST